MSKKPILSSQFNCTTIVPIFKQSSRAKNIRITVTPDLEVIVTTPLDYDVRLAEAFVHKKEDWIENTLRKLQKRKGNSLIKMPKSSFKADKVKAHLVISEKVESFSKIYGFSYNSIKIKQLKSMWGSCSRKKNLNFNYKLIYLPTRLLDYVVVHEICHLKEFNHSPKFWKLVGCIIPNYKELRKELHGVI